MTQTDLPFDSGRELDRSFFIAGSPIESGFRFVREHKWRLIALASIALIVELACDFIIYSRPLVPKQTFVIWLIYCAANAWLLTAVQMFAIEVLQHNQYPSLLSLARRALIYFPKILLSYAILMIFFGVYIRFPPGVVLLVFFMWAPAFCVGELYWKKPEEEEEDDYEDEGILFQRRSRPRNTGAFFAEKAAWELGFVRSVRFVITNLGLSFQIALLHWFSEIVPRGIVLVLSGGKGGYTEHALGMVVATFSDVFVLAMGACAFLFLLPPRAYQELGFKSKPEEDVERKEGETERKIALPRVGPRAMTFVAIALVTALFSWYLLDQVKLQSTLPNNVKLESVHTELNGADLLVQFDIKDSKRHFRWLEPDNFRLTFPTGVGGPQKAEAPTSPADAKTVVTPLGKPPTNVPGLGDQGLSPRLVSVYEKNGEKLNAFEFKPYYKPLRLSLYYKVEPNKDGDIEFALHYLSELGLGEALIKDKLPSR